jgi:hypothetical protein
MQKKKKRVPEFRVPVSDPNIRYLPGSTRSVSDPNPKLYYPGITRIHPEYKNICIRKMVPNQYPYPVPVSGTQPVFTPNAVHEAPGARWRSVVVDEDVIVEDEPPQRERDLSSPTGVVGRRRIQHHGHEGPDVVQSGGLSVESSDEVGVEVRGEGILWGHRGFRTGERRVAEEALCGGHLGGQSGAQGTLTLQGEGGGALALPRGRHCGLDRSEGADERGVGDGECGGRDGVAPGWGSEGGKARRGAVAQGQRGSGVEWPEAGDVGGPSMGELAADCSRGNGEVRAGTGGDSGGAHGGQHGRSGGGGVRVHQGDGAAGGVGTVVQWVAVGLAAASGRGRVGAAQLCCGGRRRDACGEGRSSAARSPGRGEGAVLGRCSKAGALGGRLGGRRAWTRLHDRRSRHLARAEERTGA